MNRLGSHSFGVRGFGIAFGLVAVLFVTVVPTAQAQTTPETKAGVIAGAQRDPDTCARAINSATSISHGVAALAVHELVRRSCADGGPGLDTGRTNWASYWHYMHHR